MTLSDELLERLAGDYVLGTLRGGARRRFERWMQQRPGLRAQVEALQIRLAPWAGDLPPRSAPPQTWQRLEARLFGSAPLPATPATAPDASPAAARDAPSRPTAPDAAPAAPRDTSPPPSQRPAPPPATARNAARAPAAAGGDRRWLQRLVAGWAGLATLALAGVTGLLVIAPETFVSPEALALRTQQLPASYVAVLSDAEGRPTLVASAARHARRMDLKVLRPVAAEPGTQWVLRGRTASGESVLLGAIDLQARSRIALSGTAEEQLSRLASLSVTAEAAGIAAPAAPTRMALLQGPCVKVW